MTTTTKLVTTAIQLAGQTKTVLRSTVMVLTAIAVSAQILIVELGSEFPIVGRYGAQALVALAAVTEGVRRLSTVISDQRGIPEFAPDSRKILE